MLIVAGAADCRRSFFPIPYPPSPPKENVMLDQPYRGDGSDRPASVPLPPARLPLLRAGRLRKQWRYVSIWSESVSICAARVAVGPVRQEFWGVWDRDARQLTERTRLLPRAVALSPNRLRVREPDVEIDITLEENNGSAVEVVVPDGRAYTWTRKQCVRAHGMAKLAGRELPVEAVALIDDNAGYHPRHTRWRWSGGAGRDSAGRQVAWSVIVGLNAPPANSERTLWIDGVPQEVGPVAFAEDLTFVAFNDGALLHFHEEAVREREENLVLVRSSYRQPFGTFDGTLPTGIEVHDAIGVMERHDAVW
jgi:hypothetical protein